jgi:hypothetical protein
LGKFNGRGDLNSENYKILKKEMEENEKVSHAHGI